MYPFYENIQNRKFTLKGSDIKKYDEIVMKINDLIAEHNQKERGYSLFLYGKEKHELSYTDRLKLDREFQHTDEYQGMLKEWSGLMEEKLNFEQENTSIPFERD